MALVPFPALYALLLTASAGSADRGPIAKQALPGDLLRQIGAGADSLQLVEYPFRKKQATKVLLTVTDAAAVAELLSLVDTLPAQGGQHLCVGSPPIRLYRGKRLVAEFSFDHVSILRALSDNLWAGDVPLTDHSALAIAEWFRHHGYSKFADELAREDAERERWRRFYEAFPTPVQEKFRSKDDFMSGLVTHSRAVPAVASSGDVIAAAIPDQTERARVICRALGVLDGDWFAMKREEQLVLHSASALEPDVLVRTIDSFSDGSPELRGAGRLLFGAQVASRSWFSRLPAPTAERLAARIAGQLLIETDDPSSNAATLPGSLAQFRSSAVEDVLAKAAARVATTKEGECRDIALAIPSLSSLVVLAARHRAPIALLESAESRSWRCPENRAAASLALRLACDQLPDPSDLLASDSTAGLAALAWLKAHPTREGIDFAFEGLLSHPWGHVRSETESWLASLPSDPKREPGRDEEALRRWWRIARRSYPPQPLGKARGATELGICRKLPSVIAFSVEGSATPADARRPPPPFDASGLPEAKTAAARDARERYRAALQAARAFERVRLVNDAWIVNQSIEEKEQKAGEALAAFQAVCESGAPEWCLAASFQQGLLFERLAFAVDRLPCPPRFKEGSQSCRRHRALIDLMHKDELEQKARAGYRATLARCATPGARSNRWCAKAMEGLERMNPWRHSEFEGGGKR